MEALNHNDDYPRPIYIETPAILSTPLSKYAGFQVYLKQENLQVPGSFKIRGIGNLCQKVGTFAVNTIRVAYFRAK